MRLFSNMTVRIHCPGCGRKTSHHVGEQVVAEPVKKGILGVVASKKVVRGFNVCTKCGLLSKDLGLQLPILDSWYKTWPYARR